MVRGLYFCCDFLYTATTVWFMLVLTGAVWKPKVGRRVQKMIWAAAVIVVAGLNTANNSMISVLFSKLFLMINMLLVSLAGTVVCRRRYRDVLCLIYLCWSTLALADFFFQTLVYTIREDMGLQPDILLTATVPRGIYLLLWAAVLLAAVRYMRRWGNGMQVEISRYLKRGWFLVPSLFVCTVYFQRIYRQAGLERLMYRWWLFLLGGTLLVLAGLAYIIIQRERERYWLLQQKAEMLEYDYRVIKDGNQEKEIVLHDIRKHMLAIREMAEAGQAQDIVCYLDEMEQVTQKGRNQDLVNHELLNLMLGRKFQEAEDLGITVQYELGDMGSLLLTSMEICAVFSNILDNALEANQALAEEKERWIKLECIRKGQMLVLSASNPMPEEKMRFVEGIPQTTKKDKQKHGLGMRSIRRVVDSHGGHMQIEAQKEIFQLVIWLKGFKQEMEQLEVTKTTS